MEQKFPGNLVQSSMMPFQMQHQTLLLFNETCRYVSTLIDSMISCKVNITFDVLQRLGELKNSLSTFEEYANSNITKPCNLTQNGDIGLLSETPTEKSMKNNFEKYPNSNIAKPLNVTQNRSLGVLSEAPTEKSVTKASIVSDSIQEKNKVCDLIKEMFARPELAKSDWNEMAEESFVETPPRGVYNKPLENFAPKTDVPKTPKSKSNLSQNQHIKPMIVETQVYRSTVKKAPSSEILAHALHIEQFPIIPTITKTFMFLINKACSGLTLSVENDIYCQLCDMSCDEGWQKHSQEKIHRDNFKFNASKNLKMLSCIHCNMIIYGKSDLIVKYLHFHFDKVHKGAGVTWKNSFFEVAYIKLEGSNVSKTSENYCKTNKVENSIGESLFSENMEGKFKRTRSRNNKKKSSVDYLEQNLDQTIASSNSSQKTDIQPSDNLVQPSKSIDFNKNIPLANPLETQKKYQQIINPIVTPESIQKTNAQPSKNIEFQNNVPSANPLQTHGKKKKKKSNTCEPSVAPNSSPNVDSQLSHNPVEPSKNIEFQNNVPSANPLQTQGKQKKKKSNTCQPSVTPNSSPNVDSQLSHNPVEPSKNIDLKKNVPLANPLETLRKEQQIKTNTSKPNLTPNSNHKTDPKLTATNTDDSSPNKCFEILLKTMLETWERDAVFVKTGFCDICQYGCLSYFDWFDHMEHHEKDKNPNWSERKCPVCPLEIYGTNHEQYFSHPTHKLIDKHAKS